MCGAVICSSFVTRQHPGGPPGRTIFRLDKWDTPLTPRRAVPVRLPCRAVPCRAVPCRVVPCRVVSCRAVPCCAVPCRCCAVLCYAVLCCAVLCCAVLCCAVLCCAVLCRTVPYRTVPCRAVPCRDGYTTETHHCNGYLTHFRVRMTQRRTLHNVVDPGAEHMYGQLGDDGGKYCITHSGAKRRRLIKLLVSAVTGAAFAGFVMLPGGPGRREMYGAITGRRWTARRLNYLRRRVLPSCGEWKS